jgi:HSP20 family protein
MDNSQSLIRVEDIENWRKSVVPENFIEPDTNIYVVNDKFIIVVNFPGIPRENIRIEIANNELTLFAKMPTNFELAKCDFYIKEFQLGNYHRKFILSDSIDIENIAAKFDNGQLTLILPKHKRQEKKEVEIE